MSGRKGMLVWKLSRSKIPVSEKKLEKESRWLGITEEHVEKGTWGERKTEMVQSVVLEQFIFWNLQSHWE